MYLLRIRFLILYFVVFFFSSERIVAQTSSQSLEQYKIVLIGEDDSFEQFLERVWKHYEMPAIAAAVVQTNGIIEMATAGYRSLNGKEKVTFNDRFHVGSCGKSMTTTLAAILVEEGLLTWDITPLNIFPELEKNIHPDFRVITLKDLVSHRAGILPFHSAHDINNMIPDVTGTDQEKRRQFTRWLLEQGPHVDRGTYEYSNAGFSIVGAMLEKVTGRSWQSLMTEKLFKPLGLKTAGFGWPGDNNKNEPSGHLSRYNNEIYPASLEQNRIPVVFAPAGDICMSIEDFAKYAMMHLRGLNGFDGLLKSETIKMLHNSLPRYSFGWGIRNIDRRKISTHSGSGGTFYARISISHDKNSALVILTNCATRSGIRSFLNIFAEWVSNFVD
ncbi:serine hydrolase domain-containing protein [candidate division KSB1 bacterium]